MPKIHKGIHIRLENSFSPTGNNKKPISNSVFSFGIRKESLSPEKQKESSMLAKRFVCNKNRGYFNPGLKNRVFNGHKWEKTRIVPKKTRRSWKKKTKFSDRIQHTGPLVFKTKNIHFEKSDNAENVKGFGPLSFLNIEFVAKYQKLKRTPWRH